MSCYHLRYHLIRTNILYICDYPRLPMGLPPSGGGGGGSLISAASLPPIQTDTVGGRFSRSASLSGSSFVIVRIGGTIEMFPRPFRNKPFCRVVNATQ